MVGGGYHRPGARLGLARGSAPRSRSSSSSTASLPGMDREIGQAVPAHRWRKQGLKFKLGTKVTEAASAGNDGVTLSSSRRRAASAESARGRHRAGRDRPAAVHRGARPRRGRRRARRRAAAIEVDAHFATNVARHLRDRRRDRGPMLAHKAEEEGVACVEHLAGQKAARRTTTRSRRSSTPGPRSPAVGKTEEQLKAAGVAYQVGKFPFTANAARPRQRPRPTASSRSSPTRRPTACSGVHIIGADAGTMIAEAALAMEFGASAEDIARTCHAHPTLERGDEGSRARGRRRAHPHLSARAAALAVGRTPTRRRRREVHGSTAQSGCRRDPGVPSRRCNSPAMRAIERDRSRW